MRQKKNGRGKGNRKNRGKTRPKRRKRTKRKKATLRDVSEGVRDKFAVAKCDPGINGTCPDPAAVHFYVGFY